MLSVPAPLPRSAGPPSLSHRTGSFPRSCFLSAAHCCRLLLDVVLLFGGSGRGRGNEKDFSVVGPVMFLGLCAGDMEFLLLE